MNNTGLFRVSKVKFPSCKQGFRYAYQIHNQLLVMDIRSTSILKLKEKVLEKGLLWGITDVEMAKQIAIENECSILDLEGRYGFKMNSAFANEL